jgi:hypothetical protein
MEWCANLGAGHMEAKVQLAHVAVVVDKRVRVLLAAQVVEHATLGHEAEEVEVAAKEYVQAHLQDRRVGWGRQVKEEVEDWMSC